MMGIIWGLLFTHAFHKAEACPNTHVTLFHIAEACPATYAYLIEKMH